MDCKEIYIKIKYHGIEDNYIFDHIQKGYKHIKQTRMYTGELYHHTLSEKTLEKLIEEK